jgi:hypothetical protein
MKKSPAGQPNRLIYRAFLVVGGLFRGTIGGLILNKRLGMDIW